MSETLQTIVDSAFSLFGLVFVVWLLIRAFKRTEDPSKLLFKSVFTLVFVVFCIRTGAQLGIVGPFVIVFMGIVMSVMWTPHIAAIMSKPITSLFDGGDEEPEPKPFPWKNLLIIALVIYALLITGVAAWGWLRTAPGKATVPPVVNKQ